MSIALHPGDRNQVPYDPNNYDNPACGICRQNREANTSQNARWMVYSHNQNQHFLHKECLQESMRNGLDSQCPDCQQSIRISLKNRIGLFFIQNSTLVSNVGGFVLGSCFSTYHSDYQFNILPLVWIYSTVGSNLGTLAELDYFSHETILKMLGTIAVLQGIYASILSGGALPPIPHMSVTLFLSYGLTVILSPVSKFVAKRCLIRI